MHFSLHDYFFTVICSYIQGRRQDFAKGGADAKARNADAITVGGLGAVGGSGGH